MSYRARVETPARLHFGFLSLSRSHDRLYGGLGAAVDRPGAVVEAEPSGSVEVEVAPQVVDHDLQERRVEGYLEDAVEHLEVSGASIRMESGIPVHAGLGSGTQTSLAVTEAVALAHGQELDLLEAAHALGRGGRSGVGVGVYRSGGFVVDAGVPKGAEDVVPPVSTRHRLPEGWRFVVVPGDGRGAHGELEDDLLDDVVSSSVDARHPALEALTSQVLPGVAEGDPELFGAGLTRVGAANGDVYRESGVQDDRYVRPDVVAELEAMDEVYGAGQSSWGPTVYGLTTVDGAGAMAAEFDDAYVVEPDGSGAVSTVAPL